MKKIAVVGSRDYSNLDQVREYIHSLPSDVIVVSGGARGVDRVAQEEAESRDIKVLLFLPMWSTYGKRAGFIRNQLIVEMADEVVAFWDGESRGTAHSIELARRMGKPLTVYLSNGQHSTENHGQAKS